MNTNFNISSGYTANPEEKPRTEAAVEEIDLLAEPPVHPNKKSSDSVAARVNKKLLQAENGRTSSYRLQPGDTVYMVRKNDTLEKIASRFHISSSNLRTANKLKSKQVTPGKHIIIPTHNMTASSSKTIKSKPVQPGETIYMVRRGDTIAKIAKRFKTSPASIRLANMIDDTSLLEGVNLVIPLPIRS